MCVYPVAATIRPRFGRKTLVFTLSTPRNWLPRNQGPPLRRYEEAANAANGSAIDGDSQGDQNPSSSWRHAGPSASCSAPILTTHDEPSAFATSPPAKSSCVRLPYGTPQPTPERQFPVTRRLGEGGGARHGHYSPRPKKTSNYTSSLGSREAVSKEPESEQHESDGAGGLEGAFELERVKHETGGVFGPEGATSEELELEKSFLPEPDCYGRRSSAPNSPQRGSNNVRPTHACSGAYCAGKSTSSSWHASKTCWWRAKRSAARSAW